MGWPAAPGINLARATNKPQIKTRISATIQSVMLTLKNFVATKNHFEAISGNKKKVFPTAVSFMKINVEKPIANKANTPQPKVIKALSRDAAVSMRACTMSFMLEAAAAVLASLIARIAGQNKNAVAATATINTTFQNKCPAPSAAIALPIKRDALIQAKTQSAAKTKEPQASKPADLGGVEASTDIGTVSDWALYGRKNAPPRINAGRGSD